MARLFVHVEGQTEESFVNNLLRGHLYNAGYHEVSARRLGSGRQRGGIRSWESAKKDIVRHLKQDPSCLSTTMVDYYGMPQGWPGRADASRLALTSGKAHAVENAMLREISSAMGPDFRPLRFTPFVLMHEFEALLFSECTVFSREIGQPGLEAALKQIRTQFGTPEDINDSPTAAPSKRILAILPTYQKPLMGVIGALAIGLRCIRKECPHFNDWLARLESLAKA